MLKNKKIIAMLLLVITLFSNCSNIVYATEINRANLTTIQDSAFGDLINLKYTLTFSTDNIQNVIYFENIEVSYYVIK